MQGVGDGVRGKGVRGDRVRVEGGDGVRGRVSMRPVMLREAYVVEGKEGPIMEGYVMPKEVHAAEGM